MKESLIYTLKLTRNELDILRLTVEGAQRLWTVLPNEVDSKGAIVLELLRRKLLDVEPEPSIQE